jgi:glutamyl-Q tRNA(Asp) synthetase
VEDLRFVGLTFDGPIRKQSEHLSDYAAALEELERAGRAVSVLLYPRRDRCRAGSFPERAASRSERAAPVYPGRCRDRKRDEVERRLAAGHSYALRLHTERSRELLRSRKQWPLTFTDQHQGTVTVDPALLGDVVLARKEVRTSYHLAVVVDDALCKA